MTGSEPATAVLLRRSDGTAISSSSTPSMRSSASRGRQQKRSLRKPCAATSWLRPRWIPKRSATPSTALVPQRKVGFPIPNAGLLLGFQGTKTARREGISSPFSDAGGCTSRQNSGSPDADAEALEQARRIAEAQVDVNRVRDSRRRLISGLLTDPSYQPLRALRQQLRRMKEIDRMERFRGAPFEIDEIEEMIYLQPLERDEKFAAIIEERTSQLAALDRYERRAFLSSVAKCNPRRH